MMHGIDVSNYQPPDIAGRVQNDFCLIRAGGGAGNLNAIAGQQLAAARIAGVQRLGLYHFAREGWTGTTAEDEAQHFLSVWSRLAHADTLPVLDWEDADLVHDTSWALRWLDIVAGATGRTPLLYCNLSVATSYDWSKVIEGGHKLWLALYGNDQPVSGYQPLAAPALSQWGSPAIWQYTQRGRLPGYDGDLDLNIAYEDLWSSEDPLITELMGAP